MGDETFECAKKADVMEWKYTVELYHAAWVDYTKQYPEHTRGYVAAPFKNSYGFWDLHLAMADWHKIMGGDFKDDLSKKSIDLLESHAYETALKGYSHRLDASGNKTKDASITHWTTG